MPRQILDESQIHPAIQKTVADHNLDIVQEVQNAIASHKVVVVGMTQNPVVKSALKNLSQAGIAHHYLEYGSYFSQWRRRNALKMWTGWPLNIPESVINEFAYNALSEGKIHKATELFKRNTQDNPNSANAWDGLADAYAKAGHLTLAVQASDRAVAVASQYANPHLENFIAQAKKRIVQIHK